MSVATRSSPTKARASLPWLKEVLVIGAVYIVYGIVRNQFGSAILDEGAAPRHSFNNAVKIIEVEKAIGMFHEQTIQRWFLDTPWIPFFNIFYGTAHFIVTLGVLIWLFVRHRPSFGRWRSTLMATTLVGLIGFALFPLMPPRLFNAEPNVCDPSAPVCNVYRYGGAELARHDGEPDYQFVDTLREVGGLWSFDSKELDSVSNQYAAMPSLHIGWSVWCAIILWKFAKRRTIRYLGVIYPFITLTAIVATANHFIIDAPGALVALGAGYLIALAIERLGHEEIEPAVEDTTDDVLVTN